MAKPESKRESIRLRKRGMTYDEIKEVVHVSKGTLSLWLRDVSLSEKAKTRLSNRRKFATKVGVDKVKEIRKQRRKKLFCKARKEFADIVVDRNAIALIGAVAYWAEGSKSLDLTFANSDPVMLKMYIWWIRNIIKVPSDHIRCGVNVYLNNGLTLDEIFAYWSNVLDLPMKQFYKPIINNLPKSSKRKTGNVLPYGTVKLQINKPLKYAAKVAALLRKLGKNTHFVERSARFR